MDPPVGIDLGDSRIVAAVILDGEHQVVPHDGNTETIGMPAYIAFTDDGPLVGKAAKALLPKDPSIIVTNLMDAIYRDSTGYGVSITGEDFSNIDVLHKSNHSAPFTKVELLAMLIAKVKEDIEIHLKHAIHKAVFTTPNSFGMVERGVVIDAARLVGLETTWIMPATIATASHYSNISSRAGRSGDWALFIDVGSASIDVAIASLKLKLVDPGGFLGSYSIGSDSVDETLAQTFCDQILERSGNRIPEYSSPYWKLRSMCEMSKTRVIATSQSRKLQIKNLLPGFDWAAIITRHDLSLASKALVASVLKLVSEIQDNSDVYPRLSRVFLTDRSAKVPGLIEGLGWSYTTIQGDVPLTVPEAAAFGAASRAALGSCPRDIGRSLNNFVPLVFNSFLEYTGKYRRVWESAFLPETIIEIPMRELRPQRDGKLVELIEFQNLQSDRSVFTIQVPLEDILGNREPSPAEEVSFTLHLSDDGSYMLLRSCIQSQRLKSIGPLRPSTRLTEGEISESSYKLHRMWTWQKARREGNIARDELQSYFDFLINQGHIKPSQHVSLPPSSWDDPSEVAKWLLQNNSGDDYIPFADILRDLRSRYDDVCPRIEGRPSKTHPVRTVPAHGNPELEAIDAGSSIPRPSETSPEKNTGEWLRWYSDNKTTISTTTVSKPRNEWRAPLESTPVHPNATSKSFPGTPTFTPEVRNPTAMHHEQDALGAGLSPEIEIGTHPPGPEEQPKLLIKSGLDKFFDSRTDPQAQYTDMEIETISLYLANGVNDSWSRIPRLYSVLRFIQAVEEIEKFIDQEITDVWFPFTPETLPHALSPSTRSKFLESQQLVMSKSLTFETDEKKRHAHFGKNDVLPFHVIGNLGFGGNGAVEKVISTTSHRVYARKLFRKTRGSLVQDHTGFLNEIRVLKRMSHRHCVELIQSYTDSKYFAILMSPVAEYNLFQFYDAAATSTDKLSLLRSFFGCLAGALTYIHNSQVRHRDIKPQNILVKGNCAYFSDFGIALDWQDLSRSTTTQDSGKTWPYAAPEVARYEKRNTSADVWSLGCVLLEMITVLKGRSVAEMRTFFKDQTGNYRFYANIDNAKSWTKQLRSQGSAMDNGPIQMIMEILQEDATERPTAAQIFAMITKVSTTRNLPFCGRCCLEGDDSETDHEEDDEQWQEDEDQTVT